MRKLKTYLALLLIFISIVNTSKFPPLNLYIGTDGEFLAAVNLPLDAQSPYGVARVEPDTSDEDDAPVVLNRYAGYHYSDSYINMFSHTHIFGAGVVDYGEVGIIAVQIAHVDYFLEISS